MDEGELRRLGRLARLAIADDRAQALADDLARILAYADRLGEVDLSSTAPLAHALDQDAPLADDVPAGELAPDALARLAPAMDGPFLRVPKVVGGGGGA